MKPIKLTAERAWRTYLGGSLLDALHGKSGKDTHFPEEWIMSTTAARNAGREHIADEGMSRDSLTGQTLKSIIDAAPRQLLGARHVDKLGAVTGVLIKLIDSSERLSIQVHPDKATAKRLFGSDYGKTECWHILGGRTLNGEEPCIYLGFKDGITRKIWKDIFERQDIPAMLNCLHRIPVTPGQTFLIPGGVPHAIGSGCFLMEIQEPTDYTVRTERSTPSGFQIADSMCHQGLGFDKMFDCFHYDGLSEQENLDTYLVEPVAEGDGQILIGYGRTPCFQLTMYDCADALTLDAGEAFRGLYILRGDGIMVCEDKTEIPIHTGDQFFLPAGAAVTLQGKLRFARLQGPQI